jgi:hypothetical protein
MFGHRSALVRMCLPSTMVFSNAVSKLDTTGHPLRIDRERFSEADYRSPRIYCGLPGKHQ